MSQTYLIWYLQYIDRHIFTQYLHSYSSARGFWHTENTPHNIYIQILQNVIYSWKVPYIIQIWGRIGLLEYPLKLDFSRGVEFFLFFIFFSDLLVFERFPLHSSFFFLFFIFFQIFSYSNERKDKDRLG